MEIITSPERYKKHRRWGKVVERIIYNADGTKEIIDCRDIKLINARRLEAEGRSPNVIVRGQERKDKRWMAGDVKR